MDIHIGLLIRKEVIRRRIPLGAFAEMIYVSRPNVYSIFARKSIDAELLDRISMALNVNFFEILADDIRNRLGDATPKEMLTDEGMLSILRYGDDRELVYYDDNNKEYKFKERLNISLSVNGAILDEVIDLPDFMFPWLLNSYNRATAGPMKGLDDDAFDEQFFPWLERQCPRQARCIKKAVENTLLWALAGPDSMGYREILDFNNPMSADEWYSLNDNDIKYWLDGLPERIIVTKKYK